MKSQSAKQKHTTQKTVQLTLHSQAPSKSVKETALKSQRFQNKSLRDKPSDTSYDNVTLLAVSLIDVKTEESPIKDNKQKIIEEQAEESKYHREVMQQKIEFLEQQQKESENKLKSQEDIYETIINAYKSAQTTSENTTTIYTLIEENNNMDSAAKNQNQENLTVLISELRDKLTVSEEKIETLESKVQEQQFELTNQTNDFKFKNKELKLQISEMQLKLKHGENKNIQKEDYSQRQLDDQFNKHNIEIERMKRDNEIEQERSFEKNHMMMDSIKETYENQIINLQNKITEMKGQMKMQEMQISEYQSHMKDKVSNNLEMLENIHIRYLEEIKNLNVTLGHFRQEKEQEIKKLKEQLKHTQSQLKKSGQHNQELTEKLESDRKTFENRINEIRKKLDLTYKQLIDHEKCEITIQAQRKRMSELKHKLQQLETREKWQWKYLLDKRGQIESEKVDLKRKMNNQSRLNRSKVCSQNRQNDDLEKRVGMLNSELETTITQKQILRSKFDELSKEIKVLKKDQNGHNGSISDRSIMARSVSPRTMHSYRFGKPDPKNSTIGNTSTNFGRMLQKMGTSRQRVLGSPIHSDSKKMKLGFSLLQASQNYSFIPSPSNQTDHFNNILKDSQQKSTAQDLPPTSQKISINEKFQKHQEAQEDELNSFLGSPKQDDNGVSMIYQDISASRMIGVMDSTALSCITRSKAVSQYEVRCKNCLKIFGNVETFMSHQMICNSNIDMIEEKDVTQTSDIVHVETSESPEMRRTQSDLKFLMKKNKKLDVNRHQLKKQASVHKIMVHSTLKTLSTPKKQSNQRDSGERKRSRNAQQVKSNPNDRSAFASIQNNRYNSSRLVVEPQILNNSIQAKTVKKLRVPTIQESSISIAEQFTAPESTKNQPNHSSIFHQSLMASHSNGFQQRQHQSLELEKENHRLIQELKQVKIDLAVHQEHYSESELTLKKEILNLQYQMNQLSSQGGISQRSSFIAGPPKGSFSSSNQKQQMRNHFNGTNINIQTTNVTHFNIGCNQDNDQCPASGKSTILKAYPTPSATPDLNKFQSQDIGIHNQEIRLNNKTPSDNFDSPILFDHKEDEDNSRQVLNQVKAKRSPNFMINK